MKMERMETHQEAFVLFKTRFNEAQRHVTGKNQFLPILNDFSEKHLQDNNNEAT